MGPGKPGCFLSITRQIVQVIALLAVKKVYFETLMFSPVHIVSSISEKPHSGRSLNYSQLDLSLLNIRNIICHYIRVFEGNKFEISRTCDDWL